MWTSTQAADEAPRRQRLRLPALPAGLPGPGCRLADRATRGGVERATRPLSLGRGEDARLASSIPPPRRPLRAPARHPPRLPPHRLRAHLVQIRGEVLSGSLSRAAAGAAAALRTRGVSHAGRSEVAHHG